MIQNCQNVIYSERKCDTNYQRSHIRLLQLLTEILVAQASQFLLSSSNPQNTRKRQLWLGMITEGLRSPTPGLTILYGILLPSWGNDLQKFAKKKNTLQHSCSSKSIFINYFCQCPVWIFPKGAIHFPIYSPSTITVLRDTRANVTECLMSPSRTIWGCWDFLQGLLIDHSWLYVLWALDTESSIDSFCCFLSCLVYRAFYKVYPVILTIHKGR